MDVLCFLVIIGIIIYVLCAIDESNRKAQAAIDQLNREHEAKLNSINNRFSNQKNSFDSRLSNFFSYEYSFYHEEYLQLTNLVLQMQDTNRELVMELIKEAEYEDYSSLINQYSCLASDFINFGKKVNKLPYTRMMDTSHYGKIQKEYWDSVRLISKSTADNIIDTCERNMSLKNYSQIFAIDIEMILLCVWAFATEKPYSVKAYNKAASVFGRLVEKPHIDITIAELYAMKQMGGEDILRERIRNILEGSHTPEELTLIASALMWMKAYQIENMILQHMLSSGMQMTAKTQERLRSLTSGGGKAPNGFNVSSSGSSIYFDVSALTWKDDEYTGLFENLSFQEKILSYSLAVRDEDKELLITQGIRIPDINEFFDELNSIFAEEYGDVVTISLKNCIALSGSGEEHINGILVESNECRQMGILVYVARIGKKLNIKFYTLFMPIETEISRQKQQVLSLYKKLSPSVTMWESSIKDTVLLAIQQYLNSKVQSIFDGSATSTDSEEPIF